MLVKYFKVESKTKPSNNASLFVFLFNLLLVIEAYLVVNQCPVDNHPLVKGSRMVIKLSNLRKKKKMDQQFRTLLNMSLGISYCLVQLKSKIFSHYLTCDVIM